jgi:DnaJ-domain-containing protein 1
VELVFIFFMLGAGGALAAFVATAMAIARKETEAAGIVAPQQRDAIAASLLFHVVRSGGAGEEAAMREVRRGTGIAAPVTRGIDVTNWAETYARHANQQQRAALLESAVQLVAARNEPVPLRQYTALLDLSFGLGFQTDALAKLRQVYGFDYVDHAKNRRAEKPLYARGPVDRTALLSLLGITGSPTRQELSAAYRKLVTQHHPDRFHGAPVETQNEAASRFIEITRAYEELLLHYRD